MSRTEVRLSQEGMAVDKNRERNRMQAGRGHSLSTNEDVDEDGDEELGEESDEEGETRCICGDIDPPDVSGLYIQCEGCAVWQHGYCVGIGENESTPDKYWCEYCKPELHSIYTNDAGKKSSNYKPITQRRRQSRRAKRGGDHSVAGVDDEVLVKTERKSEEEEDVKAEQEEEDVSGQSIVPVRGKDGTKTLKEPKTKELNTSEHNTDHSHETDEKTLLNRKRATLSAREEKQYQLMLEKAIQESRRTSQPEEVLAMEEHDYPDKGTSGAETSPQVATSTTSVGNEQLAPPPKQDSTKSSSAEDSGSAVTESMSSVSSIAARKRTRGKSANSNSSSEDDGLRKRSRRAGSKKATNHSALHHTSAGLNGASNSVGSANSTDISINKPIKPRLPTQKTTVSEMKRRIGAILEFLSRTQVAFAQDELEKEHLVQFVENDEFMSRINAIFKEYDQSLKMMDSLTRKLLLWEQKYAEKGSAT